MSTEATATPAPGSLPDRAPGEAEQPEDPALAGAPEGVREAAEGGKLTDAEEHGALHWLLGPTTRPKARVPVTLATEAGDKRLIIGLVALDGRRIQQLDDENRKGDGPFAKLDTVSFNVALACEAIAYFEDETGQQIKPDSEEFIGGMPGGLSAAMELRFKYAPGILETLGERVRELSAYSPDRVGQAQRVLVDVAGNS